jgi:hypothetical protein
VRQGKISFYGQEHGVAEPNIIGNRRYNRRTGTFESFLSMR